jgi:hypothetical protein
MTRSLGLLVVPALDASLDFALLALRIFAK